MRFIIKSLIILYLFFLSTIVIANELPDDSIYHIDSNWTNQNNEVVNIASLKDKVQVMVFVYTYCEHSCPVILAKLKIIEGKILPEQKENVRFLLVSLDPERDTPEVLNNYMKEKQLDDKYWQMFSGDPESVLELSALAGVRYKPMNNDANDIEHSNMITILDKKGRIHYQMKGLDSSLEKVVSEITQAVH
jgi:protein SCO1/2